jgi:murein DD-endopeptidase MepM/ murein hydrolase activator NlpD
MRSAIAGVLLACAGLCAPSASRAEGVSEGKPPIPHYAGRQQGGEDAEAFTKLFKTWKSVDRRAAPAPAPRANAERRALASASGAHGSSLGRQPRRSVGGARLTSGFGMREHPLLGVSRPHLGVDLAAPTGTPVFATADGVVGRAGASGGYGLSIALEHAAGMETRYGHLSRLNVTAGQRVRKGDVIGFVGSTGLSTGPHLHYETRVNGRAVNPMPYISRSDRPK